MKEITDDTTCRYLFASDNTSGVHPVILKEIELVNRHHVLGYGEDKYTREALSLFKEQFGPDTEAFPVFTGTAANVLCLAAVMRSWNSVITASTAHLEQDECGAPEKFTGCKVLVVDTPDGKITVDLLEKHMYGFGFEHHSQPRVISVTQSTEMGTVYSPAELVKLADYAHSHGMYLHMDGARLANAAVALNLPFRAFTSDCGVDILSFGGTKNGMMYGEAVCFLRKGLSADFKYLRKQAMQLASKMRFISAQFTAFFRDDLWRECAAQANRMAGILADRIRSLEGIKITREVQSNGVFVIMPDKVAENVRKEWFFYTWNEKISEYRLMTGWDTREEDIEEFVKVLSRELQNKDNAV
jgi:threonine aldolase